MAIIRIIISRPRKPRRRTGARNMKVGMSSTQAVYIYIYIYIYTYLHVALYSTGELTNDCVRFVSTPKYESAVLIYIYIYIEREREMYIFSFTA